MPSAGNVIDRLRAVPSERATVASVGLVVLTYLLVGWTSLTGIGDSGAYDSAAIKDYAETVRETGACRPRRRTTNTRSLPGIRSLGASSTGSSAGSRSMPGGRSRASGPARRGAWMLLCVFGLLTLTLVERRRCPGMARWPRRDRRGGLWAIRT